jgi:hypothetical protein
MEIGNYSTWSSNKSVRPSNTLVEIRVKEEEEFTIACPPPAEGEHTVSILTPHLVARVSARRCEIKISVYVSTVVARISPR